MERRETNKVVVHCSASLWGDLNAVNAWHIERGWSGIGYHFLILNQYPSYVSLKDNEPDNARDGVIEEGRGLMEIGAHVSGENADSIGVCLVGVDSFTERQISSLKNLLIDLKVKFPTTKLYGHYEFNPGKDCPNIEMTQLRLFWDMIDNPILPIDDPGPRPIERTDPAMVDEQPTPVIDLEPPSLPWWYKHKRTAGIIVAGAGWIVSLFNPAVGGVVTKVGGVLAVGGVGHALVKNKNESGKGWRQFIIDLLVALVGLLRRSK